MANGTDNSRAADLELIRRSMLKATGADVHTVAGVCQGLHAYSVAVIELNKVELMAATEGMRAFLRLYLAGRTLRECEAERRRIHYGST